MHGRIWVDSEPGQGSSFRFTSRFALPEDASLLGNARDTRPIAGFRILVVDDNRTNRRVLEEVLLNWGALPSTTADGPAALLAIREAADAGSPFAIALIDGMMPGMDGFELASRIRELPGIDEPLMVMLTSSGLAGEAERSRGAGIAAYLTKPVRQSELRHVLTRIVKAATFPKVGGSRGVPPLPIRAGGAPSTGLRILLAEDQPLNQKVAVAMLRRMGHEPMVVGDGREALEAWLSEPFDLILMDIQMPVMDGFEALAAIRAREPRERGPRPDCGPDGSRDERRPRTVPRGRLRRLSDQANLRGQPLPGDRDLDLG